MLSEQEVDRAAIAAYSRYRELSPNRRIETVEWVYLNEHDRNDWRDSAQAAVEAVLTQRTEPAETEDVANVVARLLYPCVFDDIDDRRRCEKIVIAALADARKGLHSEEEIEKALQDEVEQWPGYESWYKSFTKNVLARLSPHKEELVTVIGAVVYLDGKEYAAFKGHDSHEPAERYATGLRAEIREGKL
jgi:hypothetical protein